MDTVGNDKDPRYEREIKHILEDMPDFLPEDKNREPIPFRRPAKRKPVAPRQGPAFRLPFPSLSIPQYLIIVAVICLVGSWVGRYFIPQFTGYLGIIATLCFLGALIVSILDNRGPSYEKKWRGQVLNLPSDSPGWQRRLQQWWWRTRYGNRRKKP
jgi:hypothetical protein